MKLVTYLSFDGTCREAFTYYAGLLGGRVEALMPFGGSPMAEHVDPKDHDRIMHGSVVFGDQQLMGTDADCGHPYEAIRGAYVTLLVPTVEEAERVFAGLAEGGTVTMPLQETFWAPRYGMLTDRFGVPWMINTDMPAGSETCVDAPAAP